MKIKRVEHIAIAVDSIQQSLDLMRDTFGLELEYEEQIGDTKLAMLPVGQTYIELLEAAGPESGVRKWINEKGTGLFHICFEVEDIEGAIAELKAKNVKLRDGHLADRSWRLEDRVPRSGGDRKLRDRTRGTAGGPLRGTNLVMARLDRAISNRRGACRSGCRAANGCAALALDGPVKPCHDEAAVYVSRNGTTC